MPQPMPWRGGLLASLRRAQRMGETAAGMRLVLRGRKTKPRAGRGWWLVGLALLLDLIVRLL
jgi:hypothetical protein